MRLEIPGPPVTFADPQGGQTVTELLELLLKVAAARPLTKSAAAAKKGADYERKLWEVESESPGSGDPLDAKPLPFYLALGNWAVERYLETCAAADYHAQVEALTAYTWTERSLREAVEADAAPHALKGDSLWSRGFKETDVERDSEGELLWFELRDGRQAIFRRHSPGVDRWRWVTEEEGIELLHSKVGVDQEEAEEAANEAEERWFAEQAAKKAQAAAEDPPTVTGPRAALEQRAREVEASTGRAIPAEAVYEPDSEHEEHPGLIPERLAEIWGSLPEHELACEIRKHQRRSLAQIADVVFEDAATLDAWEQGKKKLHAETVRSIAVALGLPHNALELEDPPAAWLQGGAA